MQLLDVGFDTGWRLPAGLPAASLSALSTNRGHGLVSRHDRLCEAVLHHVKIDYQQLDISADVSDFLRRNGQFHKVYSFYCLY
ncbi:hypothetical protein MRX96_020034 [Rhipicephalus microplus]